ncbi:hypothetical protein ILP97_43280 [Amycolatopsis sp. H6(2020)]|nr:hypothetical protein [Amycolatopsis sp. H6(2020)]
MIAPRRPTGARAYLDDPACRSSSIPPTSAPTPTPDAETVIGELLSRESADAAIIVRGAALLSAADAGTAAECLATSMTWLYG